jgi:hypothetical protein
MMSLAEKGSRYVNISSESDLLDLKLAIERKEFDFEVDTLVLDTMDEFQRILLAERMASERRGETNASDYGWLGQRMHTIIDGLCGMDLNVVITCHPKDVVDGVSGQLFIKPGLQGAFAEQVIQYVDYAVVLNARDFTQDTDLDWELGSDAPISIPVHHSYRALVSYPTQITDWVKDLSGALPGEFPLDFETDYERIAALLEERRAQLAPQPEPVMVGAEQLTLDEALPKPLGQMSQDEARAEAASLGLRLS